MKVLKTLAVTAVLGLGACEQVEDVMTSPLTDERLASQAGGVLGINPNNLTVIERRSTMGSATFLVYEQVMAESTTVLSLGEVC